MITNQISLETNKAKTRQADTQGGPLLGEVMKPVKISVTQLRQGMMVVTPATSWINAPFVYGKSGIIKSAEEIRHIIACGFTEAYYDPERSEQHATPSPAQQTTLVEELCRARDLYFDAFNYIKNLMQ